MIRPVSRAKRWLMAKVSSTVSVTHVRDAYCATRGVEGPRGRLVSGMAPENVEDTFAMSPAFARLTGRIISGQEGLMKPDPAIFELACQRFGFGPGEALFVDDSSTNVAAARAVGFHVHHFTDPGSGSGRRWKKLGLL